MPSKLPCVYWDSCIYIDGLRKTAGRFSSILPIEGQAKSNKLIIVSSALCIAEVVKLKQYGMLTTQEEQLIRSYFGHKFLRLVQLDRPVARLAAEIVRNDALKPPDAVHIATAIRTRCQVLYTYDDLLLKKDGMIGAPTLPIKKPGDFGQGDLF